MTHDPAPLGDAADVVNPRRAMLAGLGGLAAGAFLASTANAGPLTPPPGPISSTPGPEPRIPINQTNTPGNANTLFRITQPGSYYLEGNITGETGKSGIEIAASGVSLDLMGFELIGVPESGAGIRAAATGLTNLTIRGGSIRSWGAQGINLVAFSHDSSMIEGVHASGNGAGGILAGRNSVVMNCTAVNNGGVGIQVSVNSTVSGCSARGNGSQGILVGTGSILTGCVTRDNGGDGFLVSNNSAIHACVSYSNGGIGIQATTSCTITGCNANSNSIHGILINSGCLVTGNTCTFNSAPGAAGIRASSGDNRIEDNHCTSNNIGISAGSGGNFIARNTCRSNTTNWTVAANNACLVINATLAPVINGNSGGTSPGSTNPNANYTY
jgi:parallel beta-helix repeat protein